MGGRGGSRFNKGILLVYWGLNGTKISHFNFMKFMIKCLEDLSPGPSSVFCINKSDQVYLFSGLILDVCVSD